jgi:diguanylate cyclase (GGDEF)-like protein
MPARWVADRVKTLVERLDTVPKWSVAAICFASVAAIAAADKATGPDTTIGVLYILPVAMAAWSGGRVISYAVAVISAICWYGDSQPLYPRDLDMFKFTWNMVAYGGVFSVFAVLVRAVRMLVEDQRFLALTDVLTGLPNARSFRERATLEIARARRSGLPLTLVYIDCDNFKEVNDAYGHRAGDEALERVARALSSSIRSTDMPARLGGDEFALILCDCGPEAAQRVVSEIRANLERLTPPTQVSSNYFATGRIPIFLL